MHIEQISNLDALFGMLALMAFATLVFRIIPLQGEPPKPSEFTVADITSHDGALPKYLVATAAALTVGAVHLAIRSIPAVADWLQSGGYGGHLLRDIAYTHMMIVMGGTVAVTGLTWYCLPRILGRPLYSSLLAELSFWGTVIGAAGFYLSNAIFGGIMAAMINAGLTTDQIDSAVGLWRGLATGISATVMGLGYWTYVANIFFTALARGKVPGPRPHRNLAKFFIVGAGGLLVGTVQGVLQVIPDNVDWLHAAGRAGQFIDPFSHAHVNLITGVLSIIAGTVFFLTRPADTAGNERRMENLVFWILVPGSVLFYFAFLFLGFTEGSMIVDHRMTFTDAARTMGSLHTIPLALSGTVTFLGIWLFIGVVLWRCLQSESKGRLGLMLGAMALCLGTLQGLAQASPSIRTWMLAAGQAGGAMADAHAQINITGGVLMMLLGAMLSIGAPMTVSAVPSRISGRACILMSIGALLYYASALSAAMKAAFAVHGGLPSGTAVMMANGWGGPTEIAGALIYATGAGTLALFSWEATRTVRVDGWIEFKNGLAKNDTSGAPWRKRIPKLYYIAPELMAGLFGFPGLGWILSGRAMVGVPLIMGGAAVSWAILPLLLSPYGDGRVPQLSLASLEIYLLISAAVSTLALSVIILASQMGRDRVVPN